MAAVLLVGVTAQAKAVTGSQFDPGNIISDAKFYNSSSMTESQIQQFLNERVPVCATGYTCLRQYTETTPTRPAGRCATYTGGVAESAARIIFKVAIACGINPQVLLVTLQKENSLVTSSSPASGAYKTAMGYACPDTAACDAEFFGFFNQVYSAARQFVIYTQLPGSFNYSVGLRTIGYNPNRACGASVVDIRNQATANLYNYTPYQPNSAALANLGGYGDACSSYGNRNFWVYFNNWFGSPTASGPEMMAELYQQQGGASGWMGPAIGPFETVTASGGGFRQAFQNGTIYWSPGAGARIVQGAILTRFAAWGGEAGSLGWPIGNVTELTTNGITGQLQSFQGGTIHWTAASGAMAVIGDISRLYGSVGQERSFMGWPTSGPTSVSAAGGGLLQTFQNGTIYWTASTGARLVTGSTLTAYNASGGPAGPAGWPSGNITQISAGGITGQTQNFQTGVIYWTAAGGARLIAGAVGTLYSQLGGAQGFMGWPTSALTQAAGGSFQTFQNGSIYLTASAGARLVTGAVLAAYQAGSGPAGAAGWPTSNVTQVAGNGVTGQVQTFQNGTIYWTAQSGGHLVVSDIAALHVAVGGIAGFMGWPTGDLTSTAGGALQTFQNGTIYRTPSSGVRLVTGPILSAFNASSGPSGPAGWPTGNVGQHQGTGVTGLRQAFEKGAVYWTASGGGHLVSGAIHSFYMSMSEFRGVLGWPTGDVVCAADGSCSQSFQGGSILWSAAGGARLGSSAELDAVYSAHGGASGPLGVAVGGASAVAGGQRQSFVGGSAYWSAATGGFVVLGPVDALYSAVGGPGGFMGWPTSDAVSSGGGLVQTFQNGSIYWTAGAGARLVTGPVLAAYLAGSGPAGAAGWPTGNVQQLTGGGVTGLVQSFQNGALYWTQSYGGHTVTGAIGSLYSAVGGSGGFMGWPTGGAVSANGGVVQTFQNGSIYWTSSTGARLVTGPVLSTLIAAGGPAGAAGWPTGNVGQYVGGGVAGVVQSFQKGAVYWTGSYGGHLVTNAIYAFYLTKNEYRGPLGWPTGDVVCAADGSCSQSFQGGSILWSAAGGARLGSSAELDAVYSAHGGASGPLGVAVGGASAVAGGQRQSFVGGSAYWSAATGGFVVLGPVDALYSAVGGPGGFMGWPTSDAVSSGGGLVQTFQNGSIYWTAGAGARLVTGPVLAAYLAGSGPAGAAGWPTGNVQQLTGGGVTGLVQSFQNGALYWTQSYGGHTVTAPVHAFYLAQNEFRGSLGWPTGDAVCASDGSCSQAFQGGSIRWAPGIAPYRG